MVGGKDDSRWQTDRGAERLDTRRSVLAKFTGSSSKNLAPNAATSFAQGNNTLVNKINLFRIFT